MISPIPDPAERAALNAAPTPHRSRHSGFWDEHGQPAPWPDDIDEWRPATGKPTALESEQPF